MPTTLTSRLLSAKTGKWVPNNGGTRSRTTGTNAQHNAQGPETTHKTVYIGTLVITAQCGGPSMHARVIGGSIKEASL